MFRGFNYEIHILKAPVLKPHLDFSPWMGGDDPTQRRTAQDCGLCSPRRPCSSPDQRAGARIRAPRRGAPAGLPPPPPRPVLFTRLAVTLFPWSLGIPGLCSQFCIAPAALAPLSHTKGEKHTDVPHTSYFIKPAGSFPSEDIRKAVTSPGSPLPLRQTGRARPPCRVAHTPPGSTLLEN